MSIKMGWVQVYRSKNERNSMFETPNRERRGRYHSSGGGGSGGDSGSSVTALAHFGLNG